MRTEEATMPRATTKAELIRMADEQFDKMWKIIDSMDDIEQNNDFCFDADSMDDAAHWKRDKNLRDVLIHLFEWHQLLLEWEGSNANGVAKTFLPSPYTWKTYGEMNIGFWEKHQKMDTSLSMSKEMLRNSHKNVLVVIERYSDKELFTIT
ncbi:MAG: ClbS/DfsB family four-helix bundle protein [Methanomassiliicoccaceae archaeon]|nr:ClbS/DfsB family four-helix bundle protein [Methanomassiliicoccaceae archaeon]